MLMLRYSLNKIVCWFVGHKELSGEPENYRPDYCTRCFADKPEPEHTLPYMLTQWMER